MSTHSTPPAPQRLVAAYGLYYLDNRPALLRMAEMAYHSVPAASWSEVLAAYRKAAFNAVCCTIRWDWHQPQQGTLDFQGQTHPQRDLRSFAQKVQQAGLALLVRPGPQITGPNGETDYPPWLEAAIPEARVRRPDGTLGRFALMHPEHLSAVENWSTALAVALREIEQVPVIAWQMGVPWAGGSTRQELLVDHNPDTVRRYRAHLAERYEDAKHVAREWRRPVPDLATLTPPRAEVSAGELTDWQIFLERSAADYVSALAATIRRAGASVPIMMRADTFPSSPLDPWLLAQTGEMICHDVAPPWQNRRGIPAIPMTASFTAALSRSVGGETQPPTVAGIGAYRERHGEAPGRPPKEMEVRAILDVVACIARGTKAYGVACPELSSLSPLQSWLARHEEEITASVAVEDPILYLHYRPNDRLTTKDFHRNSFRIRPERLCLKIGLSGFFAVLATAGYNPQVATLENVTDESILEFPATILPALGSMDIHEYGKLVVTTLRGGTLITFPQPVTQQIDGSPLKTAFLWPRAPLAVSELAVGHAGLVALQRLAKTWWHNLRGGRWAGNRKEGASAASASRAAIAATDRPRIDRIGGGPAGDHVNGDWLVATFAQGGEELLRRGSTTAGYREQVRDGTSTLLGTVAGGAYATSVYVGLAPAERLAWRRLALYLLEDAVPRHLAPDDDLELELVARLSPDGGALLFMVNRLGEQAGTIRFPFPEALNLGERWNARVEFSASGSTVEATPEGMRVRITALDAMIVRLT